MPYEYRKMTPEERTQLKQNRRERGYPLHNPPHPFRDEGYYLLTAANYEHAAIMEQPVRCSEFEVSLLSALSKLEAEIVGWVVLPNHYHTLVGIKSLKLVSNALKQLHGSTSYKWNKEDGQTGKRKVWYNYNDHVIRTEEQLYKALNYIHINPMKHGYSSNPYDWPWSSVHNYFETQGREWLREKWTTHHPGDYGRGWDD